MIVERTVRIRHPPGEVNPYIRIEVKMFVCRAITVIFFASISLQPSGFGKVGSISLQQS